MVLERTCHLCGEPVSSRVWYATLREQGKRRKRRVVRVYACPACFFEKLEEEDRDAYQREANSGAWTRA